MKRTQLIVLALIATSLLLASAGAAAGAARTTPSVLLSARDNNLIVQINVLRKTHRLSPLRVSKQLTIAANQHTTEMAQAGYFAHDSLDHTEFSNRIERSYPSAGYRSWRVGENLLAVVPDVAAAEAITLWMHSAEHRAILLDSAWREIGVFSLHSDSASGTFNNEPVTIITADFGVRHKESGFPGSRAFS